ncbi:hypothetical protein PG984_014612 [Apiospora sp. TS-2023a]
MSQQDASLLAAEFPIQRQGLAEKEWEHSHIQSRNSLEYEAVSDSAPATICVDSRARIRASAVLRHMLNGGGGWEVRLSEDSPSTFCILLDIFRTQFDEVPSRLAE